MKVKNLLKEGDAEARDLTFQIRMDRIAWLQSGFALGDPNTTSRCSETQHCVCFCNASFISTVISTFLFQPNWFNALNPIMFKKF
jgi:hypothetical protein